MQTKHHFSSIAAIGRYIADNREKLDFAATHGECPLTLDEAVTVARHGGVSHDTSNLDKLKAAVGRLNAHIHTHGVSLKITPAVAGAIPSIPRALGGSPKAMLKMSRKTAPAPVVRIGVNVGRRWSVTADTVYYRAAALLAICDQMERKGQRAELVAVWRNKDDRHGVNVDVTIKKPGEYYTPAALAFALDPSFQRRFCWGMADHDTHDHGFSLDGYGNGRREKGEDFDYYAPYLDDDFDGPEDAYRLLTELWGLA